MEQDQNNQLNGRFTNPTMPGFKRGFFKALFMWLTTKKAVWPEHVENTATPNFSNNLSQNQVAITFVNHATFLIQLPGLNILTDPVWSKRVSPFSFLGPKRVREPGIKFSELPKIDVVIISHNHYDHLDIETLRNLNAKFAPLIIVPFGDKKLLHKNGIHNVHELTWWQSDVINANTNIHFTPTQHFSARGLFDHSKSLWGSYVIEYNQKLLYFGGDGGYCTHFINIYNKFGSIDLSFLGIGAYEPSWFMRPMHTDPKEAILAHIDLHSKQSIAMHFGTFQLSAEALNQPVIDLKAAVSELNIPTSTFTIMQDGETRVFNL